MVTGQRAEATMQSSGSWQKEHYDTIHDDYEHHYYDEQSMAYRERFYYAPLFADLELNHRAVADIASGSGHNSLALLRRFPHAEVTGFEISSVACEAFRRNVGRPCIETDLTQPLTLHPRGFDVAMIFGGLHHCVANLPMVFQNLALLVKPGGLVLMVEPNREFVLDWVRRVWYRVDRYFDSANERALNHSELLVEAAQFFSLQRVGYYGGPGYFLISQSLLFRMPKSAKAVISPGLMAIESAFNAVPVKWAHPYFIARWVRTDVPSGIATLPESRHADGSGQRLRRADPTTGN
jgi:SAM-dependent methyltransferase